MVHTRPRAGLETVRHRLMPPPRDKTPDQTPDQITDPPAASDPSGSQHGRITIRSVITGALLSLIVSVGFTYTRVVLLTTGMNSDFITAGAIFVFFGVTLLLNPCIRLVSRSWAFDRAELAVIYIMLIIASTIPTWGFSANLIPMLPAVYYFASPENR